MTPIMLTLTTLAGVRTLAEAAGHAALIQCLPRPHHALVVRAKLSKALAITEGARTGKMLIPAMPVQVAKPQPLSWNDIVFEKDGVPMADSRKVAEVFGKEHRNVLQTVDRLIREMTAAGQREFDCGLLNFQPSSYRNARNKEQPCFHLTRDGFSLLAMGFTGAPALKFKLDFIAAFNAMEQELRRRIDEDNQRRVDELRTIAATSRALAVDAERAKGVAEHRLVATETRAEHHEGLQGSVRKLTRAFGMVEDFAHASARDAKNTASVVGVIGG